MKNRIGSRFGGATPRALWSRLARRRAVSAPVPPALPAEGHRRRLRRARLVSVLTMSALAAVAAVISYSDGLFLVRLAGTSGRLAYLYPLLPDGLIIVSWARMYEAGTAGIRRPKWATAGIVLGACLTLSMNVGAGVLHNRLQALVDGVVPVVLFVALEILMGSIRADRAPAVPKAAPDASGQQETPPPPPPSPVPPTTDEALRTLLETGSIRGLAETLGVPKSRIEAWGRRVSADDAPEPEPVRYAALNGSSAGA